MYAHDVVLLQNRRRRDDATFTEWQNYGTCDIEKAGRMIGRWPDFYRALDIASGTPLELVEPSRVVTHADALAALETLRTYFAQ